ncbi:hypothetical protein [Pseudomonas japonica]|uniref:Uncharacterized protein n=1 Tax=Pseudomonas japonica TaxID=256466 RepID=A0A239ELY1_9PSED|nr:hypothetical protein [Pseudomonas japonica]SNS44912.1 hypothetical protein SAMN05444352_10835 [Pseudomonas japonica]
MEPSQIGLALLVVIAITGSVISLLDHRIESRPPRPDDRPSGPRGD